MAPPKSQTSPLTLDPDWTTLPLARFSHANSLKGASKHQWVHDPQRDELWLVFRPVREAMREGNKNTMKMLVYAGAQVLEDQNIDLLLEAASKFEQLQRQGQVKVGDEAPLRVVVRCPCIAFRFPAPPESPTVRRVQMRFKTDEDYNKAVRICSALNLPVEVNKKTTPSGPSGPAVSTTSSTMRQQILSTAETTSESLGRPMHPSQLPEIISRPISRPISAADFDYMRSQSLSSETMRPDSVLSMRNPIDMRKFDPLSSPLQPSSLQPTSSACEGRSFDALSALHGQIIARPSPTPDDLQRTTFLHPAIADGRGLFSSSPSSSAMHHQGLVRPVSSADHHNSLHQTYTRELHQDRLSDTSAVQSLLHHECNGPRRVLNDTTERPSPILPSQALMESHPKESSMEYQITHSEILNFNESRSTDQLLDGHLARIRSISGDLQRPETYPPSPYIRGSSTSNASQLKRSATISEDSRSYGHSINALQHGMNQSFPELFRPMSAPMPATDWMPPPRELPFAPEKRPRSRLSPAGLASDATTSVPQAPDRPTTSTPPNTVATSAIAPKRTTIRATQRKVADKDNVTLTENGTTNIREQETSPLAAKSAPIDRPSTAPGLRSKAAAGKKRLASVAVNSDQPNKQARQMVDQSTQTQTLSGRDHTVSIDDRSRSHRVVATSADEAPAPSSSFATAPTKPLTPVPTPVISQPMPANFVSQIQAMVSAHTSQALAGPQELWQRPRYADASPEERQAMMNDFICDNLENPEFLMLCEDSDEVWRRIGLGT